MRLRPGVTAKTAIAVFNDCLDRLDTARSEQREQLQAKYVAWARFAELKYRELFADDQMLRRLQSGRHWHIRAHGYAENLAIGPGVFDEELNAQKFVLNEAIAELTSFQQLAGRLGDLHALDTNTLLHYQRFDQIKWSDELGSKSVRLVVPLVVLDEVDEKTYASNSRLAGRAESVLRALDQHIEAAVDGASEVRPGTTIEILQDPPDHVRSADKDHEILNRAEFVAQVTERKVTVISGDRGMRVRGRGRGMTVRPLRPGLRHRLDEDAEGAGGPVTEAVR